jgi:hypothetical protein
VKDKDFSRIISLKEAGQAFNATEQADIDAG